MKKAIWCSRHPLGDDQLEDLQKCGFGKGVKIISSENIVWSATADRRSDIKVNRDIWQSLIARVGRYGIIAGVFPPVALEAKPQFSGTFSPVSEQSQEIRADGEAKIVFKHVRWAKI